MINFQPVLEHVDGNLLSQLNDLHNKRDDKRVNSIKLLKQIDYVLCLYHSRATKGGV
jgi:hypothetical protein